uniref:Putative secreted protein n=1 Tax=Nyssomyia neivai TaxID=330878 RepID=A0A1L8DPK6_9DIPT
MNGICVPSCWALGIYWCGLVSCATWASSRPTMSLYSPSNELLPRFHVSSSVPFSSMLVSHSADGSSSDRTTLNSAPWPSHPNAYSPSSMETICLPHSQQCRGNRVCYGGLVASTCTPSSVSTSTWYCHSSSVSLWMPMIRLKSTTRKVFP